MGILRSLSLTPTHNIQKEFLGHFCKHSWRSGQKVCQEPQKTTLQVLLVKMGTLTPQPIMDKITNQSHPTICILVAWGTGRKVGSVRNDSKEC